VSVVALRSLWGRKLRTSLTVLAVVLGVATVSGTYVLTDAISGAFDTIFREVYRSTDAAITGKTAFAVDEQQGVLPPSFAESLLARVRALPGVAAAVGGVAGQAQLIGADGKVIQYGGAPNLGFSLDASQPRFNSLTLEQGSWPGPDEVVVDAATARKAGIAIGDRIGVQAEGRVEQLRVSGIVTFGAIETIGGATLAGFDLRTAQRLFRKQGKLDQIRVAAKPGVSEQELLRQIRSILPPGAQVRSGAAQARSDAEETNRFLDFLQSFLLAFAGIALFVGAFVIANALSITVAQRTRELATLRTLGASRGQVLTSVLVEAGLMGALAAVAGLFLGLALARGLFALFETVGFTLPRSSLALQPRTVLVCLLVGPLVTLAAGLRPALRATRVPPIAAVREGSLLAPGRLERLRAPAAALLAMGGFAVIAYGLFAGHLATTSILLVLGGGALLVFLGVALLSPQLVPPLARLLGEPGARLGGAPGLLARENARRNPQRTGATAAALMVGLALVTLVAMLAEGVRSTFRASVDRLFIADYAVTAQNNFSPIPIAVSTPLRTLPGVQAVVGIRTGQARILGSTRPLTAVDGRASRVLRLDWRQGSPRLLDRLGRDAALVTSSFAEDHGLRLGSRLEILVPSGKRRAFRVRGIWKPPAGGSPLGPVTIAAPVFDSLFPQPRNALVLVRLRGGASPAGQRRLERALADFPNAKVADREQFKANQVGALDAVLNVLYVLLALSVVVSLLGIVNTLVLSVFERTRELGMLRAVGMTRRQVRRMIRYEGVITALIGACVGMAVGIALAVLVSARVDFIEVAWPLSSLLLFLVGAVVVGFLAALLPARRAARLSILEALQYE
jgi:putative ABC transport system permease protein